MGWYLGYGLNEKIPHFSTFSKNYSRRFANTDIFEKIFSRIIKEILNYNFIDIENVFVDGTHIKANANNHKYKNIEIEKSAKFYEQELRKEIDKDRIENNKKPFKYKDINKDCTKNDEIYNTIDNNINNINSINIETKFIKQSTTDLDCGLFHKGEHKKVFAYTANVACDKNNFILDFEIAPGNYHDSSVFPKLYYKIKSNYISNEYNKIKK